MSDVRMVKLGDLCDIVIGRTPARKEQKFWNGDIPWLSITDMNQGTLITRTKEKITESGARNGKLVPPGTVLFSFKLSIGKVGIAKMPLYTNEAIVSLPIKDTSIILPEYLMRFLEACNFALQGNRAAMGKTLNKKSLHEIEILVPSIRRQLEIVAILSKVKKIQEAHERQIAALDELASSLFISTFPKEGKYNIFKLSEIAKTTSGGTPSRKNPENYGGDILWVKSGELQTGYITDSEEKITEVGMTSSSAKIMPAGTILFAMYGATAGAVAKLGVPAATNQAVCCITPNQSLITDTYLMSYLKFRKPDLINMRTGGAQPNLSQSLIRNLDISLPPLEAQKIFSEKIKIIESRKSLMRQAAKTGNEFFTSVQNILFDH